MAISLQPAVVHVVRKAIGLELAAVIILVLPNRHQLIIRRCRLKFNTSESGVFDRRFDVMVWNSPPDELRDPARRRVVPIVLSSFLRQSCLVFTNVTSTLEVF